MTPMDNMDMGLAADQPPAGPSNRDKFWWSSDTQELSVSDGSVWTVVAGGGGGGTPALAVDVRANPGGFGPAQNVNSFTGVYGFIPVPLPVDPDNDRRWSIDVLGTLWNTNHTDPFRLGVRLIAHDALVFNEPVEGGQGYVELYADGNELGAGNFGANLAPTLSYQVDVPAGVAHTVNIEENIGTFHDDVYLPVAVPPTIQATGRVARIFATGVAL